MKIRRHLLVISDAPLLLTQIGYTLFESNIYELWKELKITSFCSHFWMFAAAAALRSSGPLADATNGGAD